MGLVYLGSDLGWSFSVLYTLKLLSTLATLRPQNIKHKISIIQNIKYFLDQESKTNTSTLCLYQVKRCHKDFSYGL